MRFLKPFLFAVALAGLTASATTAHAQFLANGSFETVPGTGAGFQGQALLPSGWEDATPNADTYSNDGSFGLTPNGFGNFPGVTAFDGIRWVAGAAFSRTAASTSIGGESFGTSLLTSFTPGTSYTLNAFLYQALRSDLDNPGGYHLFLAAGNTTAGLAGAALVGALAPTTGVDFWEARSLTFVAPTDAAARPFLVLAPYRSGAGASYPGIDSITISATATAVPEPGSIALLLTAGVPVVGILRRRRKH